MKILVTAASKHGSTAEIATALVAGLRAHGADADIAPPEEVQQVTGYDVVVIGSAIYVGRWLRPAKDLIEKFAEDLANRAVYLFSSGPIGRQDRPVNIPPDVSDAIDATGAREHRMFAGKLDPSVLSVGERVVARMVGARAGDFRDWDVVGQWAGEIVDAVGLPPRQSRTEKEQG